MYKLLYNVIVSLVCLKIFAFYYYYTCPFLLFHKSLDFKDLAVDICHYGLTYIHVLHTFFEIAVFDLVVNYKRVCLKGIYYWQRER